MAKKEDGQTMKARALLDLHVYGYQVTCGKFFIAPADVVKGLEAYGVADTRADEKAVYGDNVPEPVVIGA